MLVVQLVMGVDFRFLWQQQMNILKVMLDKNPKAQMQIINHVQFHNYAIVGTGTRSKFIYNTLPFDFIQFNLNMTWHVSESRL
jgi:hypothetical protein